MIAAVVLFVMAAVAAGVAIWLFVYSDQQARRAEVMLRLRAGEEAAAATFVSREAKLKNPIIKWACYFLWRTGSDIAPETVTKVLLIVGAMIPVTWLIFGFFGGSIVIAFGLAFGYGILRRQAAKRRAKIVSQMPGFLEAAMRVLQAGNTFEESIAAAAVESPDPLKPLFQSVGRQVKLGAPIDQVLAETGEIHRIRDVKVMALAAAVNRKYGGSLRNIFRSLIGAIRARDSAARELRALTAETRFSAVVLAVIPAVLTLYIYFQNRAYYADMWASTGGRITLCLGVGLQVLGVIQIYRMMASTEDAD
ncbi:MAG TPA: type II secretion system F family protein [Nevskiaceae bacterium]|nr:type II secretion system F family protein [Nevskiaceae bacterium]